MITYIITLWLEPAQKIELRPYKQMVYAKTRICPTEWDTHTHTHTHTLGFWDTNGSPHLCKTTRPININQKKKKRTCRFMDLAVPADDRVKFKENDSIIKICQNTEKNLGNLKSHS